MKQHKQEKIKRYKVWCIRIPNIGASVYQTFKILNENHTFELSPSELMEVKKYFSNLYVYSINDIINVYTEITKYELLSVSSQWHATEQFWTVTFFRYE